MFARSSRTRNAENILDHNNDSGVPEFSLPGFSFGRQALFPCLCLCLRPAPPRAILFCRFPIFLQRAQEKLWDWVWGTQTAAIMRLFCTIRTAHIPPPPPRPPSYISIQGLHRLQARAVAPRRAAQTVTHMKKKMPPPLVEQVPATIHRHTGIFIES